MKELIATSLVLGGLLLLFLGLFIHPLITIGGGLLLVLGIACVAE